MTQLDLQQRLEQVGARVKALSVENLALHEALDTVEAERDALQQQVNALEALPAKIAELERRWEFRTPTPFAYDAACAALGKHRKRADEAEAELARLKAQEPVGEVAMMDYATTRDNGLVWVTLSVKAEKANSISLNDKMFSAACDEPCPAVLPNPKKWQEVEANLTDFGKAVFSGGYNQAIEDAKALGCQPQRIVVKLPPVQRIGDNPDSYFNDEVYDAEEMREAIRAAGGEIAE